MFAMPGFRLWIPYCGGSSQTGFCHCTLRRVSDPPEPILGPPRYLFKGVPPQPNCPSTVVPTRKRASVRDMVTERRCSTFASPSPRRDQDRRLPSTLCIRSHIPATNCSKTPRGLLVPLGVRGLFVHVMWFHRVPSGDSGALVVPFMHVGTYPTRHLATLRESELLPAFAGP